MCKVHHPPRHTHTHLGKQLNKHTHTHHVARLTREYDDSVMTPTTSLSSFTLLSSFSQPSSLAVHITLPDSRGGEKEGDERERREAEWDGRDEKLQGGGTIGQTVCMCECAEIAQGKHKLAWELNHLSTVPLSEKAPPPLDCTSLLLFSSVILSSCSVSATKRIMMALWDLFFPNRTTGHGINIAQPLHTGASVHQIKLSHSLLTI